MEKKKSKNILLAIMGVLILAELAASILSGRNVVLTISKVVSLSFIAIYGFWLYKKPHGNMLKYAMLLVALAQVLHATQCFMSGYMDKYSHIVMLLSAGIVVYVSGRLNRIEQNRYLLPIATIVEFVRASISTIPDVGRNGLSVFTYFYIVIALLTLMIAYFVRYKEHKEAGLMDAPKK